MDHSRDPPALPRQIEDGRGKLRLRQLLQRLHQTAAPLDGVVTAQPPQRLPPRHLRQPGEEMHRPLRRNPLPGGEQRVGDALLRVLRTAENPPAQRPQPAAVQPLRLGQRLLTSCKEKLQHRLLCAVVIQIVKNAG